MELIVRYGNGTVTVSSEKSLRVRKQSGITVDAKDTKSGIFTKLRQARRWPDYLWESWDSLNDCLRDYDEYNRDCLKVDLICGGSGLTEEQRIFFACLLSAALCGQNIGVLIKLTGRDDMEEIMKGIADAIYAQADEP